MQITYTDFRKIKLADLQEKLKEGPLEIVRRGYKSKGIHRCTVRTLSCSVMLSLYSGTEINPIGLRDTNDLELRELGERTLYYYDKDEKRHVPFAIFSKPTFGEHLTPSQIRRIQAFNPNGKRNWRRKFAEKYGVSVTKITQMRTAGKKMLLH